MSQPNHPDALEIELIRSLFEAIAPASIMSVAFLAAGGLAVWQTGDPLLLLLVVAGVVTSAGRLTLLVRRKAEIRASDVTIDHARRLQRYFSVAYAGFALVLGMFGDRVMQLSVPGLHMLTICLLVGYGAGVATSVSLRPRIAMPSMMVATVPAIIAMLSKADAAYWATALLTSAFLSGGVAAVRARHARAVKSIGRRLAFSAMARQDGLTALPNRLALREWFDEHVTSADRPGMVAVHYLDLNGFKPVNDSFGHPIGDALLVLVSERIARTIRSTDMAARFGGDEFAVVQRGITCADDAALLAQRLAAAIARPYGVNEHSITISTCVGYAVSDNGLEDLEYLLCGADDALYASKRAGGGVTRWQPTCLVEQRAAA